MTLQDSFQILGVAPGAGIDEVKKAFRNKAKRCHPDLNTEPGAHEEFIRIHTAYEISLAHLNGKPTGAWQSEPISFAAAEVFMRRAAMKKRAETYARMKYEEFVRECEAYHNSPYSWIFKILYYGLYYLYIFCASVFAFVPFIAGFRGGVLYFLICMPLFILAYFTVKMANGWKKEIDPLFD